MNKAINKVFSGDVITNISYFIVGLAAIGALLPTLPTLAPMILAGGSGVHHYYKERWSAYLDWIAMYIVFSTLFGFTLFQDTTVATGISLSLASVVAGLDLATKGKTRHYGLGAIVLIFLIVFVVQHGFGNTLHISFLFGTAFTAWKLGEDIGWADHRYRMYHGFWHILTSYAIWKTYEFVFDIIPLIQ